jgi:two-component system chemotaxis sensor kinase CheA
VVDFKKLYTIFVEEAAERIAELENGLLQLERSPDDSELVNTIFRAAHTIKGSSGSLGLKDISVFTHGMEEILDLIRLGKLAPDKDIISALLNATDLIKEMVDCVAAESEFDFARCANISARMNDIRNKAILIKDEPEKFTNKTEITAKEPEIKNYKIVFAPSPDIFKRGIDPAVIIEDLRNVGQIIAIKSYSEDIPVISKLDPENLYLKWDIQLKTDKEPDKIKKVFEFVEDDSEIKILPLAEHEYRKYSTTIGQMLVEEGVVKPEDIHTALGEQKKLGEILIEKGKASCEDIEKALEKQRTVKTDSFKKSVSSTIRVDLKKLDHLINTVGEMVIIHSMFHQSIEGDYISGKFEGIFMQLQRIGKDIQESAMALRMLPVGEVFQRFTRLVRELSESKGKKIDLIISGEDTELDKGVLEKIADPLVHLIRNSIDHGIESPEERLIKGKPEKGSIHLSAYQMGDSVYIEVEDDGKGLNKEKIIEKALSKGVITSSAALTDEQIYNLIFLPGFSTADKVTDVSGRGVGMDVVKRNIEALNGKVNIITTPDAGTVMSIKLPLTLAIIDGLKVLVGEDIFVVPITSVIESLRPKRQDVQTMNEKGEVINVRDEFIPMVRLYDQLGITSWKRDPWEAIVVLVSHEGKKLCLLADELIGEQQVVLKNLGKATPKINGIAGGTILGDGKVALVLDVPGIMESAATNRNN